MSTKHTPGPWHARGSDIYQNPVAKDNYLGSMAGAQIPFYTDNANAARIVECVNACEGVENPAEYIELARGCVIEGTKLEKQNDRIKKACAALFEWQKNYPPGRVYAWDRATTIESELNAIIAEIENACADQEGGANG